ncbi:glycosyltransferase family 2 protein [Carboxylicivirga sp. A043]|uniref:glycosyltransferase family 2 protein n=1 Tax=Carboxylicivirga litoralis TaxID=2816963 RepID=UPI0021CB24E1|nr:glycosyltransferase family 2 protein [Carboxylicivirga sp. A043]MCU4157887.1 glycosyltransferase family 2 protein [Carboxylicivirga sp. A043]
MKKPQVSLFLTTYNWPEALSLCLQSIASQSLLPNEVIVADDGSGDETKAIVEKFQNNFPCPLIHVWQEDKGYRINTIRNQAIKKTSFSYIIQIDGDIICDKDFIKDHISFARKNRFVIGRRVNINKAQTNHFCQTVKFDGINSFRNKTIAILHQQLLYNHKTVKGVRGCNMAYWRDDAFKANGYDENMTSKGPNDKEFAVRLVNNGIKAYNLKFYAIAYHLHHGEEGLRTNYKMLKQLYDEALATNKKVCSNGLKQL